MSGSATMMLIVLAILSIQSEARYFRSGGGMALSIPQLLHKVYREVGRDRFVESWREFNSRASEQQDDFLMGDLSDEESFQLATDFEHLGEVLGSSPGLVELYGDFERNLNVPAFIEMDLILRKGTHPWWGRIKKFLYRKMEKLADEIEKQENAVGW